MPSWKKVIVSGSDAALNSLNVTNGVTGSLFGTSSYATSASQALTASYAKNLTISGSISGANYIDFSTNYIIGTNAPAQKEGRLFYDSGSGALAMYNWEQDVTLNIGQESWLRARNQTGVTITNGSVVKLVGAVGDRPTVALAQATDQTNTFSIDNEIIGMATHDIEHGTDGFITTFGAVNGLNTAAYSAGDILWVSQSAGQFTNVAPSAPFDKTFVGIVVRSNVNTGAVFVTPLTPIHFHDISSVSASVYQQGDLWMYRSGSAGLANAWINTKQLSGSYSITGSLNVTGAGITGSLFGTASYATSASQAISSSFAINASSSLRAVSASNADLLDNLDATAFVLNSQTSSMTVNSASFAINASSSLYSLNASSSLRAISSSFATFAASTTSASYSPIASSSLFATNASSSLQAVNALTASFVNTLNQIVLITGSATIGATSAGPNENTLTLGAKDTVQEGGQLGLNAPGGTYTSASFIDNWQNQIRILKGNNTTSTGEVSRWNLHSGQMGLAAYTGSGAFPGTTTGILGVDSSGNIITTTAGGTGTVTQVNTSGTVNGLTLTGGPITSTGTITLGGTLSNILTSSLAQSGSTIGSTFVGLGSTVTTLAGLTSVTATNFTGTASYATSASQAINATTAAQVIGTVTGTNTTELVRGNMADNDQFRILIGGTGTNAGYVELATADDGTEPIYVRQYSGVFSTIARTATLLDGSGNTQFPGSVSASSFLGPLTGTSSYATSASQAISSSFSINASSSLRALTANSASYATIASSSLFATNANDSNTLQGNAANKFVLNEQTSSMTVLSASFAANASSSLRAISSSFATLAATATTASYATTAQSVLGTITNASTASNITPAITNTANNRVLTDNGGGTINGESNLTFDGTTLGVTGSLNQGISNSATNFSHAQGNLSIASGRYSHAEGDSSVAIASGSHAEGGNTFAGGDYSHAEGNQTSASATYAHSEGWRTQALNLAAHSEGQYATASGASSHAEGDTTIAIGQASHAEGSYTVAIGNASHAAGYYTSASGNYQSVIGQYNIPIATDSTFIIGNGTGTGARSNLLYASGSQVQITGSLVVTGGITGSFSGTTTSASFAISASHADLLDGLNSTAFVLNSQTSSMTVNSASFAANASSSLFASTSSFATRADGVAITNNTSTNATFYLTFAGATSGNNNGLQVDSSTLTFNPSVNTLTVDNLTGTASYATTSSRALIANSATSATSASYATVASSSLFATTAGTATSATSATSASYATIASSSLFATTAGTATSATSATSASYATVASSSLFATTAGTVTSASRALSASNADLLDNLDATAFVLNSQTSSMTVLSSSFAVNASSSLRAVTANSATSATSATSASYATVASSSLFATTAGTATSATSAGSVTNAVTFNNGGAGDASGTTFNGSAARTISYNSIGAPSTGGTGATGTWGISISGNAATATSASYSPIASSSLFATTAGTATTATNATNVAVTDTTSGTGPYYLMFADGTTGNRVTRVDSSTLQFNATTNTLTVPNLAGTASAITTLTQNVDIQRTGGVTMSLAAQSAGGSELRFLPNVTAGVSRINVGNTNSTLEIQMNATTRATFTQGGALGLGVVPTNTAGRFEASNDIVAYSSSDKNWKKNIKNIDSPLEKISQISGVEFDWIEDEPFHGNKGHDVGVIAQEIELIIPEAVQTRESGMKAVQYDKIIPLLIESIKEQQKQID